MRINLLIILLLFAFHAGLQAKDSKNISFKKTVEKIASKDDSALSEARAEIAVILADWKKRGKEVAGFLKKSGGSVELYGAIVSAASNMENPGAVLKDLSAIRHETFHNELLKSFKSFKDKAAAREILFSSAGKLSGEYDISLLIFIDENRFTEAAGVLLQLLGGRTAQIREYAARLLKDFGTPDIHEAVIERISFETSAFTGEDAGFLKLLLDILAIQGTADSQSTIISTMKFAELSEHACSKLLEIGESGIPYLALALKAKDTERSGAAMKCLRRYGGAAVGEASKLLTHPSEDVRLFALSFVSENGGVEIIPELVRLYDEGKPFPKDKILDLLSNFEVRHYEGIVDELLNSDQTDERIKGLSLLEKRCETGYRKKIISMLEDDEEASIREKAAAVIFHAGLDEAVPVMERMAQYEEENFALNLVHYLGFMGGADTADVLMGLRKGKSAKLGEAAGLALEIFTYSAENEEFKYEKAREFKGAETKLAFDEFGLGVRVTGKGKAIFVIPGGPDFGIESVSPYFDDLSSKHSVVYINPFEVRTNFKAPDNFSEEAKAVHRIKEKLGISEIVIAAHDSGALPAIKYAALFPDDVKALILINPQFPDRKSFDESEASLYSRISPHFQNEMKTLIAGQGDFCEEALSSYFYKLAAGGYAGGGDNPHDLHIVKGNLKMREQYLSNAGDYSLAENLAELKPYLGVILTEYTIVTSDQKVQWKKILEQRGKGRWGLKTISDCGHFPQITCGKNLIKAVKSLSGD